MNVAIIGGNFGFNIILPAIKNIKSINLIGFSPSSSRTENQKLWIQNKNLPICSTETILSLSNVDMIFLATPPMSQATLLTELLKNDSHLFVEKPLSFNCDEALMFYEVSKKRYAKCAINYTFFGVDQISQFLKTIKKISILRYEFTWRCKSQSFKNGKDSWKFNSGMGGGGLNNLLSHFIALINVSFGDINSVRANLKSHVNNNLIYNEAKGFIELVHSSYVKGELFFDCYSDKAPEISLRVFSNDLKITLINLNNDFFTGFKLYVNEEEINLENESSAPEKFFQDSRVKPVERLIKKFIMDIGDSRESLLNFFLGFKVQKIVQAISNSSNRGGSWINLKLK